MLYPGDVISYREMCDAEGINTLQRGMNYRIGGNHSVILLSRRPGAPYCDEVLEDGRVLIYEGHDIPRSQRGENPKSVDQPEKNPSGSLTQNGLFAKAARERGPTGGAEPVNAYEKIHQGIWAFAGRFLLTGADRIHDGRRFVFRFRLELDQQSASTNTPSARVDMDHTRIIPTDVKLAVWKRDKGRCCMCGLTKNLHFDHIIPYSLGGTSTRADNIQLLCAAHNLAKHNQIQ